MNIDKLDLVILKTITHNKQCALEFINECDDKVFSTDAWNFAKLVIGYITSYKEVPTLRTITEKLNSNGVVKVDYINDIWNKLENTEYNDKEFVFDLQRIKNRYIEKQLYQFKDFLNTNTNIDQQFLEMQRVSQKIKTVKDKKTQEVKDIKDFLPTFRDNFLLKKKGTIINPGIKTGFSFFDEATGGVKGSDMILVTAESGFGKSTWLLNAASNIWRQKNTIDKTSNFDPGFNIAYFSLEMPYENCFNKLISHLSGVAYQKIENPKLTDKEDVAKIKMATDFIHKYPNAFKIIDIPSANANDINATLDTIKADVVFVDYLGIMTANSNAAEEQDWLRQGIISQELRSIARLRNIPIFSAVQLNRKASKDAEDAIGLHRLSRSAQIATHCTTIVQLETRKNEENFPELNYWLIKNRNGPKGKGQLLKNLACSTLLDMPATAVKEAEFGFTNYNEDLSQDVEELEL